MGVVYRAEDTKLKRTVALKFLPQKLIANESDKVRFLLEAQAFSAINHPNVCVIPDIQEHDGQPFIVMEYVEGKTLEKIVGAHGMPLNDVLTQAIRIAEGLQAAHDKGIVHSDIKSSNIMITDKGQIKIMDFGLAKFKHDSGSLKLTVEGSTVGTLAYMSPEQIEGKEADARSDIFSFGVVLYEMLTGKLPFKREYSSALMYSILNDEPEPINKFRSDPSPERLHVLNQALTKEPEKGYQVMTDLLNDMDRLQIAEEKIDRKSEAKVSQKETAAPGLLSKIMYLPIFLLSAIILEIIGYFAFLQTPSAPVGRITLAVADISNETDEEVLDGLSALMITSLEQSQQIEVLTRSRMADILKQLGKAETERIDEQIAAEICRYAHVNILISPLICKLGNTYIPDVKVLDIDKDKHLFADKERGASQASVYDMIDRLAVRLRKGLKEIESRIQAASRNVIDITTPNIKAWHHYWKGEEFMNRLANQEAISEFKKAVELDSSFGMAYLRLGMQATLYEGSPEAAG